MDTKCVQIVLSTSTIDLANNWEQVVEHTAESILYLYAITDVEYLVETDEYDGLKTILYVENEHAILSTYSAQSDEKFTNRTHIGQIRLRKYSRL